MAPPDDDRRLAALEEAVAALRAEVAELRQAHATPPADDLDRPPAAVPLVPLTYAEFAATHAAAHPASPPGLPRPTRSAATSAVRDWISGLGVPDLPTDGGFETLVGRYGAVAVGALVLLMGVGAFLTWAVENFTLTPVARVALGALGAAALAALGERLRRRPGAERFGEVLLALALAVVHVDAWAAGPYLRLVAPETALGVAALASLALTALAWRTRQQSLFVVGVGGALLAPFVSGAGETEPLVRPLYGWVVLTAGLAALVRGSDPARPWRAAARLLALGAGTYAVAQLGAAGAATHPGTTGWALTPGTNRNLPPTFALACAAGPFILLLWNRWRRDRAIGTPSSWDLPPATSNLLVRLVLAYLGTTTVALWAVAADSPARSLSLVALALVAAVTTQRVAALPDTPRAATDTVRPRWPRRPLSPVTLAAFVLPLATLGAAIAAHGSTDAPEAAAIAALWTALSAAAATWSWRRSAQRVPTDPVDPRLGSHVAAAGLAAALALTIWSLHHAPVRVALLGLLGALLAFVFDRVPGRTPTRDGRPLLALLGPVVVLFVAALWGGTLLQERPAFGYTPFLTGPSVAMAMVTLGWCVCAAAVWRTGNDLIPRIERAAVIAVALAVGLLWGREELARVGAPDLSTFLLVGYWALAGVVLIAVGRARGLAPVRQGGLALTLYAAGKAILQVSQLDAVALRVGSYLLVGGFLLGVGYWYRATGPAAGDDDPSGDPPGVGPALGPAVGPVVGPALTPSVRPGP